MGPSCGGGALGCTELVLGPPSAKIHKDSNDLRIHTRDTTRSHVWHDSWGGGAFVCIALVLYRSCSGTRNKRCDLTPSCVWHDLRGGGALVCRRTCSWASIYQDSQGFIRFKDVLVWYDSFILVTWFVKWRSAGVYRICSGTSNWRGVTWFVFTCYRTWEEAER